MSEELDHTFFEATLVERLPVAVQEVVWTYSAVDSRRGLAMVVPAEVGMYFAHEHPRSPGSEKRGLVPNDGIRILSDGIDPESLRLEIESLGAKEVLADLRVTDECDLSRRSEQLIACCLAVAPDEDDPPFVQALLSDDFTTAPETQRSRDVLLDLGDLAELFDCDDFWYIEWTRGEPGRGTQTTQVPAAVRGQSFREDLETWDLSRWGRFVKLPRGRPWKWSDLPPAAPVLIEQSIKELTDLDPRLPAEAAAYMRLATLEIAFLYLLQLCLGEEKNSWWSLLDDDIKKRLSGQLVHVDDLDELQLGLTFIDFQRIIRSSKTWRHFASVLDPGGAVGRKNVLSGFEVVESIRNRVMHPVRLVARPIRPRDLETLDRWLFEIRAAIERAERQREKGK